MTLMKTAKSKMKTNKSHKPKQAKRLSTSLLIGLPLVLTSMSTFATGGVGNGNTASSQQQQLQLDDNQPVKTIGHHQMANYDQQKLDTIKEMYEIAKNAEVGGADVYQNYASDDLMQAFEMFDEAFKETGLLCNEGMDTMWLSQDADYSVPLSFALEGEHFVKVTIGDLGVVNYKMVCNELGCAIDDVFTQQEGDEQVTSLKRYLLRACR